MISGTKRAKLVYRDHAYNVNSVRETDLEVEKLHQREDAKVIAFQGQFSPFSNFYAFNIQLRDTEYSSLEQYYQASEAKLHGDLTTACKIMLEKDQVQIKKLSKQIKTNPNIGKEEENCQLLTLMEEGLIAKFSNPHLQDYLLKTNDKCLVEASQYDTFWGCGKSLDNPECLKLNPMTGNHLGRLLVKVREQLKLNRVVEH